MTTAARRLASALALVVAAGCADAGPRGAGAFGPPLDGYDDARDVEALRARLSGMRAIYGRSPAAPFSVAQSNMTYAKQWIAEGIEPAVALENSMQGSADEGERDVNYWCLAVDDLRQVKFPAALMRPQNLNVAIGIFKRAGPEAPHFLVLLATPSLHENRMNVR